MDRTKPRRRLKRMIAGVKTVCAVLSGMLLGPQFILAMTMGYTCLIESIFKEFVPLIGLSFGASSVAVALSLLAIIRQPSALIWLGVLLAHIGAFAFVILALSGI
jgi:hypothetical protein